MKSIFIIANREITTRIKTKAFIISTVVCLLLGLGMVGFFGLTSGNDLTNLMTSNMSSSITDMQEIREEATNQTYQELGISPEDFDNKVNQKTQEIATQKGVSFSNSSEIGDKFWIGYIIAILMYMAIMINSAQISMGVAEEKTSSIAEVVLGATSSMKLMTGKIIGIGVVGLIQILIAIIPPIILGQIIGLFNITLQSNMAILILIGVLFFVVGYISYAALYAAFASTVSRMEDVQSAITPVTFFAMFGFIVSVMGGGTGILNKILNYTPLLSPFGALSSYGKGEIELWQLLLSFGISVAFLPFLIWIGSKIYSYSILKKGSKISPFEVFKAKK